MEALESIKESKQDIMRLTRQASPLNGQDPDRITDYPRGTSPNTSMLSLSSRRSSLSTMSQSSLTSDSSFDASRKPTKKILKNPHHPNRRSKHRVRWKLPNSDASGIDSDTMSVDSFESSSSIYNRARSGLLEVRQNWKDFEHSPPRGSTGITPIKPHKNNLLHPMRSSSSTGALRMHHYYPPSQLSTIPQGAIVGGPETKSDHALTKLMSPLTYKMSAPNHSTSSSSVLHSTPIKHTRSASAIEVRSQMQLHGGNPKYSSDDVDVPSILRLESSNLSDLEESTLEDRKRMHIFQFPHQTQHTFFQSPNNSRPNQSIPIALLEDDDASDYDHLSPLHDNKYGTQEKQMRNDVSTGYSDQDIDDALEVIAKESAEGSSESHPSSSNEELPPPLPPKERKAAIGSESIAHQPNSIQLAPTSTAFQAQKQSTLHTERSSHNSSTRQNHVMSPQTPPPVPPKMRRKKQRYHFSANTESAQEDCSSKQIQGGKHSFQRDRILPPPTDLPIDRQSGRSNTSPTQSPESTEDQEDPMSSVSNTTLVGQEDTPPMSSKFHTVPLSAAAVHPVSHQHTDSKQSWSVPGLKDRIVVGAEDPGPPIDKRLKTSTNQRQPPQTLKFTSFDSQHQTSQGRRYFQDSGFPGGHSQPATDFTMGSHSQTDRRATNFMVTTRYNRQVHSEQANRAPERHPTPPTSPRHKISLETAFTEGNLLKGKDYVPPKHSIGTYQSNKESMTERSQPTHRSQQFAPRANSVGHISRPVAVNLSPEEEQVRQRFYSGGKLSMMKPVVHVNNQSVTQLLRELDVSDKKKHSGLFILWRKHCSV